ncbi:MAG: succinate dehydrogenase, cytochrome b556 subunit [Candidatus Eisenbacteria bacterium]|nr:succinate dehydrogenase, cytochrome b556 subunit [Candidatus Eisenbacteria bacterium]
MRYRWHSGYVAWLLNRITGIAISLYLIMHIWVIHHLAHGKESYAKVMLFLNSPIFWFFELCLIGAVLYHTMNGIRLVLVDFAGGAFYHKRAFWVVMAIGVVLYVICAWELAQTFVGSAQHAAVVR